MNILPDHPARDLWDTLYVEPGSDPLRPAEDGTILRTHTSPAQIRAMKALTPPIRVITPGRCFRYENVAADRNFEFFQIEALVVDRNTSLADLKGMLEELARAMYGSETRTRFRPGYYPFTEPSVAFDTAAVCGGIGCPVCKRTGWVTILGAGMVHPTVIRNGGHDPDEFQGYAVGFGLDRLAMNRPDRRHAAIDGRRSAVPPAVPGRALGQCWFRSPGCASMSTSTSPRGPGRAGRAARHGGAGHHHHRGRLDRCRGRAAADRRAPSERTSCG